jgi:hypothetical protein
MEKITKTVSHRRAPQSTAEHKDFSVLCGALRWLFIHMKTAISRRPETEIFAKGAVVAMVCAQISKMSLFET